MRSFYFVSSGNNEIGLGFCLLCLFAVLFRPIGWVMQSLIGLDWVGLGCVGNREIISTAIG